MGDSYQWTTAPLAVLQYNTIQYNTIQYNITLLSRKREICLQRSNYKKYNRDKKNKNK